jgi:hypothetical protein
MFVREKQKSDCHLQEKMLPLSEEYIFILPVT